MSQIFFTTEEQTSLASEAARAPSVHNVQPARWSFEGDGWISLLADENRRLRVGDPSGHDHRVSLGAAFEGMRIALSRRGYLLGAVKVFEGADPSTLASGGQAAPSDTFASSTAAAAVSAKTATIARARIEPGAKEDSLAAWVDRRAAWRGGFKPATPEQLLRLREGLGKFAGVYAIEDRAQLREVARLADQATLEFNLVPAYFAELWGWLRFSRAHSGWSRDGLNADAMALSAPERWLGGILMRPCVFAFLAKLGLAGLLVAESPKSATSSAFVVLTAPKNEDTFETGRTFYRLWLEICAAGFSLCPMSALADSKSASSVLAARLGVPADRRIVNVLRVGIAPRAVKLAARLPARELLLGQ